MTNKPISGKSLLLGLPLALLIGCGSSEPVAEPVATDAPPPIPAPEADGIERSLRASTALPPGQSGHVSSDGQTAGNAQDPEPNNFSRNGPPAAYGDNLDDQRALYWTFQSKDGLYHREGVPQTPRAGVEIYFDEFGIPAVYADNVFDVWFGAAFAIAQQRLFLMDAVRRLGRGNFAEVLGCGSVSDDIMQRVLSYSLAEYDEQFERLTQDSKDSIDGYVAGANAWLNEVRNDPSLLPAEYGLLSRSAQQIPDFVRADIIAAGVLITRSVATDGGTEWQNIRALRALEAEYGVADGRSAFLDLNWFEDEQAASSIPAAEGRFPNHAIGAGGREAVFNRIADWATALPDTLEHGPGTGVSPPAFGCSSDPGSVFPGLGDPQGQQRPQSATSKNLQDPNNPVAAAVRAVRDWGQGLHGGSYMAIFSPEVTANNATLMVNGPQLGYSYPSQLVEIEIHGGGYNARGSTVPALPAVGIGYSEHVAWGLTTGYSKTIDSFIDTICSNAQVGAGECTQNQYFHNGDWQDMECRTEEVRYRLAQQGAPVGEIQPNPVVIEVCRTIHGPIVARDNEAGLARSVAYAMWDVEIDNLEPIREWARAETFADMHNTVDDLTWNENLMVASADGNIAYYHPGNYPVRHAETDQRFPIPGDGSLDFNGFLPFSSMPQTINPAQGYVVNWNNKPAFDWLGGEGVSSHSRPGGSRERVSVMADLIETRNDWDYDSMQDLDRRLGTIDPKAQAYLPAMLAFGTAEVANLSQRQLNAFQVLAPWDGTFYDYDISFPPEDDTAENALAPVASTVFEYWVAAIRETLFSDLRAMQLDGFQTPNDADDDDSIFDRQGGVGNHVFDMSVLDNLAVRILDPDSSSLAVRFDGWANGRTANQILNESLNTALDQLEADFNSADVNDYQRPHPRSAVCSLTGGIIGPCLTMPYQDRGSWNQIIGYEAPAP